jgi:hypothetical protein
VQEQNRGNDEARASWGAASSAPTESDRKRRGHGMPCPYEFKRNANVARLKAAATNSGATSRTNSRAISTARTILKVHFSGQEKIGPA